MGPCRGERSEQRRKDVDAKQTPNSRRKRHNDNAEESKLDDEEG